VEAVKARPLVGIGAVVVCSLFAGPALGAPLVCSTSALYLGADPIPGQVVQECATPPDVASSEKSYGFVDTLGSGSGNLSAMGGIRTGVFSGSAHVSIDQESVLETQFTASNSDELFDALTVQFPALDGTGGTLLVPIHVTGGISGTSLNDPTAAPALPPTINGALQIFCTGSFVGGCGSDSVFVSVDDGAALQPFDEMFVMTIPFAFDQPVSFDVTFRLSAGLRGAHCCSVDTFSGIVDGSDRGAFGPATVLDANGAAVSGATIVSDSGYDYLAPEPDEWTLDAAALVALAAEGRRRPVARSSRAARGSLG
jgi:hypothetical protein